MCEIGFNLSTHKKNSISIPDQSLLQLQGISENLTEVAPHDAKALNSLRFKRKYGLQPKFVRMRELHLLLFYLTRSYDAPDTSGSDHAVSKAEMVESVKAAAGEAGWDEAVERDVSEGRVEVYRKDLDWRTFIPPMPQHDVS